MVKYRYHEVRKACPQWYGNGDDPNPLPQDINKPIENAAAKFGDKVLSKMLADIRTAKLYGTGQHYDNLGNLLAEFEYQHGICPRIKLVKHYNKMNIFARSIHNDNIDMRKENKK